MGSQPKQVAEILNLPPSQVQQISETSDQEEINLTEEEKAEVLKIALHAKVRRIREAEYWKKVNTPPPVPVYSSEEFLRICIARFEKDSGSKFVIDEFNREIVETLSKYFNGDPSGSLNLKKGLLLQGTIGSGKTTIMRLFRRNALSSFHVVSCRNVSAKYSIDGHEGIEPYFEKLSNTFDNPFRQDYYGVCFDDLGTETEMKNYGNKANVMEEILLNRYDRQWELSAMTHVTTNLSATQIEEFYGPRVRSRLREMLNIIQFDVTCPDRRN